ncbi:MAG TPA: hypothetical protein VG870_08865, partial [Chitinophagaceae bacterium]|nr:hypothetical protein [Chitinophagaceae bacterium]
MKRPAFLLGLLILWQGITAQPFHVDSLRRRVAGAPPDTAKVRLLGTLSTYYNHNHLDSGFYFTQQMIALARQLNDPYGEAWGLSILATSADRTGDMTKSLEVALSCLHLAEKLTYGHDEMIMRAYTQMGVVNFLTGHNRDAINYLHQALYYARRWQPDESAYYQIYAHLGNAHRRAGNLDSSSYYIEKSYNLSGRGGDVYFYPYVRNCEGEINEALGRLDRAKQFYRDAVVEGIRINHLFQLSYAYSQLASLFNRTGELDSSIFYAKKSLQLSREFFYGTFIPAAANLLSQAFEKKNRPDSALKYLRLTMEIKDRVMNQTKQQQFQLLEFEEQQRLARTALANQQYRVRVRTTFLVGGILLLILLLSLLYRNNRLKQKSNRELLGKTKELELAMQHLQETQAQLVHSEKMASLGAMTAGIAHEIQNPLNFVKNFSEVNKELLGELRQDIAAGNLASADQLAQDLESNEEKIIHHGKRADAIVKGMLQHARASGGQKEPT